MPALAAALEPFGAAVAVFPAGRGPLRIDAYGAGRPDERGLRAALGRAASAAGLALPAADIVWLPAVDWLAVNRADFPPLAVGRFFVHDSDHGGSAPAGAIALQVDAATAFGSGRHPTTAGCLLAVDALARRLRPRRVLDMGCGSGILALAAARAFRAGVTAVDIDPEAVRVTAGNARRNGVARLVRAIAGDGYAHAAVTAAAPFDLVLANILARPLARMAASCARVLAPGGHAVLSGFLDGREAAVAARHRAAGLALVRCWRRDGWSVLLFVRRAPRRLPSRRRRRSLRGVRRGSAASGGASPGSAARRRSPNRA